MLVYKKAGVGIVHNPSFSFALKFQFPLLKLFQ